MTKVMISSVRLFLAFALVEKVSAASSVVPWIQGEYVLSYNYLERRYDQDSRVQPPCIGPVPYLYTFTIQIIQQRGSNTFSYCYTNTNCAQLTFEGQLVESTLDNLRSTCAFTRYRGYSNLANSNLADIAPEAYPLPLVPRGTDSQPLRSFTFDAFSVPIEQNSNVWGSFCKYYNWPETSRGRNQQRFGTSYWGGAWRHENESWVFLRDAKTCPCYPACIACEHKVPNSRNMYEVIPGVVGETCLRTFGVDISECNFRLVGVGGGAMEFYESDTGYVPMPDGTPQRCFSYYSVTGVQTQSAEELQGKLG